MAVLPIRLFPDICLTQKCKRVTEFGTHLKNLLIDLTDTLNASPGVGLAAPQIGVLERVSIIDLSRSKKKFSASSTGPLILVNPVLLSGSDIQIPREGCLSVPDLLADIRRYEHVTVRTQNEYGKEIIIQSQGFEALALQHEIDHLEGKLFLDRISNLKTDVFRRKT